MNQNVAGELRPFVVTHRSGINPSEAEQREKVFKVDFSSSPSFQFCRFVILSIKDEGVKRNLIWCSSFRYKRVESISYQFVTLK